MRVKLGYKDRLVEINDDELVVFDGRLHTAPLGEAIRHYVQGTASLPPAIRAVVDDVAKLLLRTGELEAIIHTRTSYEESVSE